MYLEISKEMNHLQVADHPVSNVGTSLTWRSQIYLDHGLSNDLGLSDTRNNHSSLCK